MKRLFSIISLLIILVLVIEFNVVATQWKFDPGTIKVKQGDKVKLMIKSEDVPHGFRLADFDISERLNPGETVNVEFTADKKGTFNFFCSVPCGAGQGTMK